MKLFEKNLEDLAVLGVSSDRSLFNAKTITIFACYLFYNVCEFIYLIYVDSNLREYTLSIFTIFISTTIAIVFIVIATELDKLLEIIELFEEFVEKSKRIKKK